MQTDQYGKNKRAEQNACLSACKRYSERTNSSEQNPAQKPVVLNRLAAI
ncbi:MAG: hypothetical protein HRT82_07570 [Henriciella sp.]|nr:hypothetical protein [Henriciella sp.]